MDPLNTEGQFRAAICIPPLKQHYLSSLLAMSCGIHTRHTALTHTLILAVTWKTRFGSTPRRPGGDPGSSNTFPSGGESNTCRPPSIRSLQDSESEHPDETRTANFFFFKRGAWGRSTRPLQEGALCHLQGLHHSFSQLRPLADHAEAVPDIHHFL